MSDITKDLLKIVESQIEEKHAIELQRLQENLENEREVIKRALELINSRMLYKVVRDSSYRVGKYVLITEEIFREDYLKGPDDNYPYHKGINFEKDWEKGIYNKGVLKVNNETYYDMRYILNHYAKEIEKRESELTCLNTRIAEIRKDLDKCYKEYPAIKNLILEWQEWGEISESNENKDHE